MSSIAILSKAQVDVDRLFHSNPPSLSPSRPVNDQRPQTNQNNDEISGSSDENIKLFRGPRHDEFDWSLTKKVLDDSNQNTVVSPFLVKLLLSILVEAAGQGTSTHRELLSILPSISTEEEMHELYARVFGSLLVRTCYRNVKYPKSDNMRNFFSFFNSSKKARTMN